VVQDASVGRGKITFDDLMQHNKQERWITLMTDHKGQGEEEAPQLSIVTKFV
jgi:hypothetical protein